MKWALINNVRTEATSKVLGSCPLCGMGVRGYGYPGGTQIAHWRHISNIDCDNWFEHESKWHREWKNKFPEAWQEYTFNVENVKHRADIYNPNKELVIEFQHSSLDNQTIEQREAFYKKMIWIVDASLSKSRMSFNAHLPENKFESIVKSKGNREEKLYEKIIRKDKDELFSLLYLLTREPSEYGNKLMTSYILSQHPSIQPELTDKINGLIEQRYLPNDKMNEKATELIMDFQYRNIKEHIAYYNQIKNKYCINDGKGSYNSALRRGYFYLNWKNKHQHWVIAKNPVFLDTGEEYIYKIEEFHKEDGVFIVKRYLKKVFLEHCLS